MGITACLAATPQHAAALLSAPAPHQTNAVQLLPFLPPPPPQPHVQLPQLAGAPLPRRMTCQRQGRCCWCGRLACQTRGPLHLSPIAGHQPRMPVQGKCRVANEMAPLWLMETIVAKVEADELTARGVQEQPAMQRMPHSASRHTTLDAACATRACFTQLTTCKAPTSDSPDKMSLGMTRANPSVAKAPNMAMPAMLRAPNMINGRSVKAIAPADRAPPIATAPTARPMTRGPTCQHNQCALLDVGHAGH